MCLTLKAQTGPKLSLSGQITLEENNIQFIDTISAGSSYETIINLTNTGDAPLVISEMVGSDPCFVTRPIQPIQPNEKGMIIIKGPERSSDNRVTTRFIIKSNGIEGNDTRFSVTVVFNNNMSYDVQE